MDWLNELCSILSSFLTATGQITVATGVGPSGIPINLSSFVDLKGKVKGIQQKIEKLQSQLAFVNEFSKGPTEEAKSKEEEREQRQEKRNSGEEPPRPSAEPSETALSPRDIQTGNEWQGRVLWDPNKNDIYGVRDKDATTWFYDTEWYKYVNNMGDTEVPDTTNPGNTVKGLNVPAAYEEGSTTFDSQFMDSVRQKDISQDDAKQRRDNYQDPSYDLNESTPPRPSPEDK